jgi:hypothetical protein
MELPTDLVATLIERGQILHSDIFEDIDHPKFFVIIGVSQTQVAGFFYINSHINTAVNRKREQLDMQYPLSVVDYPFLDHTSYICATDVQTISRDFLTQSILTKKTKVVDTLKSEHLEELLNKLRNSRLFSPIIKRTFFY